MATDTGVNLLAPGKTPKPINVSTFINTIKAVYDFSDVLRASIASAGNDHRLGCQQKHLSNNLSIYKPEYLSKVYLILEQSGEKFDEQDEAPQT